MTAKVETPNVSEFLNAANWEYAQSGGNPADLTPFLVKGRQLSYVNRADGIKANAWLTPKGQVIVAYQGTQFVSAANLVADPATSFAQLIEDVGVASGKTPAGETDAASFARQVAAAAKAQGISASNVFLTGHSLGGIQAQYAAQQTGLGGIAFESTGIPRSSSAKGSGANFVNVVTYGDSIGNYSSDIDAEQPFSPKFVSGGRGALPHYGYVAMIGSPADQTALKAEAQTSAAGPIGVGLTAAAYGGQLAAFHLPDVQAHDLGVTLTQQPLGDQVGVRTAPVLNGANLTIPQLIKATEAEFSRALPPAAGVSASSGPYAGQAAVTISEGEHLAALGKAALANAGTIFGTLTNRKGGHIEAKTDTLLVTGNTVNRGEVEANGGDVLLMGNVTGTGTLDVEANMAFELGGIIAAGQTTRFGSDGGTLRLDEPGRFEGKISGFGGSNTIDVAGFSDFTKVLFHENAAATGGVLTLADSSHQVNLRFAGQYTTDNFAAADGTLHFKASRTG